MKSYKHPGHPRGLSRHKKDLVLAIVLIAPTVYILARIFVSPIVQSIVWSFQHYSLFDGLPAHFNGIRNYVTVLKSGDFWTAIYRTVYFTIPAVLFELIIGIFSAILLNEQFKGRIFFRAAIIIPWAMLTLVTGLLFNWIYQPGYGAFTTILRMVHILGPGMGPVWLANSNTLMNFVIVADVWKMTPFMTLLLLAGLQSVPGELYEAAAIDGAGFWRKLCNIIIPSLMPSIIVAVVLRTIGAFRIYDILTVFTSDPTISASYLTFNNAFRYFDLGKASSMAWLSSVPILALMIYYLSFIKRSS